MLFILCLLMGISGAGFTTAMTKGSARFLFYLTAVPKYMPTGLHSAAPRMNTALTVGREVAHLSVPGLKEQVW